MFIINNCHVSVLLLRGFLSVCSCFAVLRRGARALRVPGRCSTTETVPPNTALHSVLLTGRRQWLARAQHQVGVQRPLTQSPKKPPNPLHTYYEVYVHARSHAPAPLGRAGCPAPGGRDRRRKAPALWSSPPQCHSEVGLQPSGPQGLCGPHTAPSPHRPSPSCSSSLLSSSRSDLNDRRALIPPSSTSSLHLVTGSWDARVGALPPSHSQHARAKSLSLLGCSEVCYLHASPTTTGSFPSWPHALQPPACCTLTAVRPRVSAGPPVPPSSAPTVSADGPCLIPEHVAPNKSSFKKAEPPWNTDFFVLHSFYFCLLFFFGN